MTSKEKFKVGQEVSFPVSGVRGKYQRKGGTIIGVEKMYELTNANKRYFPDGTCRGELTTHKYMSKGKVKGYAYRCKTIQPEGYMAEVILIEEFKLKNSTKEEIINSYHKYKS